MNILLLKRDKIGDMLLTTPMIAVLREALPDASIDVLANDYNAWVVAQHPALNHVWSYPRSKIGRRLRLGALIQQYVLTRRLHGLAYDVVIIAGGEESPRAIQRALALGAPRVIGFCSSSRLCAKLSDALPPRFAEHEARRMLHLLEPLGIAAPADLPDPVYRPEPAVLSAAQAWLEQRRIQQFIVIGLGARRAKKQPSASQILRWVDHVFDRYRCETVFMWTPGSSDNALYPGDDAVAESVLAYQHPHIHAFRGPIMPAIGLIWHARCSIFPDSGLMHFAAASPGGVIGLFADTSVSPSPKQWGPLGPRARYLEASSSVTELSDASVFNEIDALLRG